MITNIDTRLERNYSVSSDHRELLDPITILVQYALLKFKDEDTRITYTNDLKVQIQQPKDYYGLLPLIRTVWRQSREDNDILEIGILKTALWHKPHIKEQKAYRILLEYTAKGIKSAIKTYDNKSQLTVQALKRYTEAITTVKRRALQEDYLELDKKTEQVRDLWETHEIEIVNLYLKTMYQKQRNVPISKEVKCKDEMRRIELILAQKHQKLKQIWK